MKSRAEGSDAFLTETMTDDLRFDVLCRINPAGWQRATADDWEVIRAAAEEDFLLLLLGWLLEADTLPSPATRG